MERMTAVEWLVSKILTEVQDYQDGDVETESEPFKHEYVNKYIGMVDLSEFVNQALQMEKDQIIQAYEYTTIGTSHYGEDYYNKTYNNEQGK